MDTPREHGIDREALTSAGPDIRAGRRLSGAKPAPTPDQIGAYCIEGVLGEGGMGVVYLARQARPERLVALKIIRPGVVGPRLLHRFEFETQVLARLEHPGIGRIYDVGAIDMGAGPQPYFAMEYVEGLALDQYVREKALSTRRTLALLAKICDAVHHAHQKGVIHRDLKPANILIDQRGEPRVLDFGVARAVDDDQAPAATVQTDVGQLVGTLPYMSPEQLSMEPADLDIRSDVYALGVIGYELLTGRLPHDTANASIAEAARRICDGPVTTLRSHDATLRGDVETIVLKAMARERERRYSSASDLASDIRAFLANRPIAARPVSAVYNLRMFARRNRAVVVGIAAVFLVLVLGVVATSYGFAEASAARRVAEAEAERARRAEVEATDARDAARREAARALAVKRFLIDDMLGSADPETNFQRDVTVRDALDAAAGRVERAFEEDPVAQVELHGTIGRIYGALGEYDDAFEQWKKAEAEASALYGPLHEETINARRSMALSTRDRGNPEEAAERIERIIADVDSVFGENHALYAETLADKASILITLGRYEEAEGLLRRALPALRRSFDAESERVLIARHNLATTLGNLGRMEEAIAELRNVFARRVESLGPRHPNTLSTMNNIATNLTEMGRYSESEPLLRTVLEVRTETLGADHPSTLNTRVNLVHLLITLERREEALPLVRENLSSLESVHGKSHPTTLTTLNQLAYLLEDLGRLERAEEIHRDALTRWESLGGLSNPNAMITLNNLAMLLDRRGDYDEAAARFEELINAAEEHLPERHFYWAIFRNNQGACLTRLGDYQAAEHALRESHEVLLGALGGEHERVAKSAKRMDALRSARRAEH